MKKFWMGFFTGIGTTLLCLVLMIGITGRLLDRPNLEKPMLMEESENTQENKKHISAAKVLGKVTILQSYIDTYYLNDVDGEKLEDGIFKGVIAGLGDRYSTYYTKDEYRALQESTNGIYCGIGARVLQDLNSGIITIDEPFEGGPAEEAGIRAGDVIVKIEDKDVSGMDITEVVALMKGKEGTKVKITILRETEEKELSVTRKEVENPTISYEMLQDKIGYIKIREFDEVTSKQFRKALNALEKKGEKALIIDLRNNGGGRLTAVVDMLDRMLPEGIIVSIRQKSGEGETYKSTDKEKFDKPLVVLINERSASASEVFAGAIQDYGAGKLVGTTSFGKGIVQTIFGLTDGTAVKLTTAEYFTPKGRNIHGTGLEPDIESELPEDLRYRTNLDKEEDAQLEEALKYLSGK